MTWIITRELNLFCNPEEIGDFFWANLFALESFKVIHCSVINVLCFALLRQLVYFIKSLFVCQALFYFLNFVLSSLSCDSLFILSKCFSFVKNFFKLFYVEDKAEKEGFEPSRRLSQPTPLAGEPLRPLGYFSKPNSTHIWTRGQRAAL